MEYQISGKIHCNRISNSRAVRKFVAKQIQRWIMAHPDAAQKRAYFDVKIDREGDGHYVDCSVKVLTEDKVWMASSTTSDLHRALKHCLARLMPRMQPAAFSSPP